MRPVGCGELSKGESEATPLLAISVVGIGVAVVIAVVAALVVLAIYLSLIAPR